MARSPRLRFLHKHGLGVHRLEIGDSTTPVVAPLYILPSAAPTEGTHNAGDLYVNTSGAILTYDGTAFATQLSSRNNVRNVKNAATTLTASDSGALCIFSTAAGYTYTLPAPVVGLWFDFVIETTITSVAAKVITDAATTFLLGTFIQSTDGTYTSAAHAANGTTIRAISMNGSTTGGLAGDWWRVTCIAATQWDIYGMGRATGAEATPFATS